MDVRTADNCRLWTAATVPGKPLVVCHGGPGFRDMAGSLAARLAGAGPLLGRPGSSPGTCSAY